ncbi:hypothetical protein C8Q74DRAFT_816891 [Fomes fomentarius]|nr:hypothetical protein C8Q74DRAFT_816891 [Fomes fomentarius]
MDLPTSRELELETLLRQRDAQVAELTDEVTHLRQFLATQPPASATEATTIPPALMSLLLPHLNHHAAAATSNSSSAMTALVQRAKTLQEENDELYELLKVGETGRLKEDVRALRRVVQKMEGALRESHQVIASLSAEWEKAQDALLQAHGRQVYPSPAPRSHHAPPHLANGSGKLPPTGPRAYKKPRISETQISPAVSNVSLPIPPKPHLSAANATQPRGVSRDSRMSQDRKPVEAVGMDVDEDNHSRPRSPHRERDRPPHRDRERDRDRDRERDKDRDRPRNRDRERDRERDRDREHDRPSRRSGGGGGGSSGGGGGAVAGAAAGAGGGEEEEEEEEVAVVADGQMATIPIRISTPSEIGRSRNVWDYNWTRMANRGAHHGRIAVLCSTYGTTSLSDLTTCVFIKSNLSVFGCLPTVVFIPCSRSIVVMLSEIVLSRCIYLITCTSPSCVHVH